jgi:hypothetical protein
MKRASYLSRLVQGAGEQPVLLPPRMLFRPSAPAVEHGFTEIDAAPSMVAGDALAKSVNGPRDVSQGRVKGPDTRQDVSHGPANALNAPRDASQGPATSLNAHRDFSQGSARSFIAEPDVNRVSTEHVTAGPDIAPVQKLASSKRARSNLSGQVVPPSGRGWSFNEVAAVGTGSVGQFVGPQTPESDRPVGRPTPISNSREAVATPLLPPKLAGGEPKTPPIAPDRERRETMGQPAAELNTKSDRTTINPKRVSGAVHPVLTPRQVFEAGRSDSPPGKNSNSAAPITLVPPAPSERFASANRPENRREAAVDEGPAVRIGTLEVRINPPPPPAVPQSPIVRSTSAPRPVVSLARGFGSFGLVQG